MRIALVGKARTGKDTIAYFINKHVKVHSMSVAYGDKLKSNLFDTFPNLPVDPKPREEMVKYGQFMREIQHDIWIEKLQDTVLFLQGNNDIHDFVITDLRQFNEYLWAKQWGFTMVGVESTVELREERAKGDSVFYDTSETESDIHLIPIEYLITNNGSIRELEWQVVNMLKKMGVELNER